MAKAHHTEPTLMPNRCNSILLAAALFTVIPARAQQQPPPPQRPSASNATGIDALLRDDQKLLSELGRRQMTTLLEHAFKKNNVPPDQQKIYLTISSLKQLNEGTAGLSRRQQQELVANIAAGIDQVLATTTDPRRLMEINGLLIKGGTVRALNTLEYWGENIRTQGQLRPVAEAIDRMYDKAIEQAKARADKIANELRDPNDPRAKEWEEMTQLEAMGRLNSAFNKYTLALAMDRSDPNRAKVAQAGIEILKEFEDPQYEVQALARNGIGKLQLAAGSKESLEAAQAKFGEVIADAHAPWALRFEAVYFSAIADLIAKDFAGARDGLSKVSQWLKQNPPPDDALRRSTEAAVMMLDYRIVAAQGATDPAANAKAIAMLQDLVRKRPDLSGVINDQLIARLPDNPAVKELNPLLLRAMVARGDEEIRKPEEQAVDKRTLTQGIAAAREIIGRAGREGLTAEDADVCTLLLGFFHSRLGQDVEAASAFLTHIEKYRADATRREIAFDNAAAAVAKLKREQPDRSTTNDAYLRFLHLATSPPFNRTEYAFDYARLLLERNIAQMQGNYSDAQKQQMVSNAERAAALFRQVPDEPRRIHARFNEMMAYDQVVDLLPPDSPKLPEFIKRVQDLADEVNRLAEADAKNGRLFKVRTALLAANLAKHDRGAARVKSLERALSLLATFEQDVQGMPNANALLGEALFIRVNALMSLRREDEALDNLGRFLETREGDEGIRIVYEMLESLNRDFQQAQQDKNEERTAELAGHRARVSGYMVDRVSQSTNPERRKLLPKYRMFEAGTLQQAASLEKDEAKRREYLAQSLKIFQDAQKENPADRGIELNIALVHFDLGNHAMAQPVFVRYLTEGLVGKPKVVVSGPDGERFVDNNQYWDTMLKLLQSNVALANAKASGYDHAKLMEETQLKLKQLYIQWGEPGGPRYSERFDSLRQQILPDWTPPAFTEAAAAADLTTQPAAQR